MLILDSWNILQARFRATVEGLDQGRSSAMGMSLRATAIPFTRSSLPVVDLLCRQPRRARI
jgi:hypothetical protein